MQPVPGMRMNIDPHLAAIQPGIPGKIFEYIETFPDRVGTQAGFQLPQEYKMIDLVVEQVQFGGNMMAVKPDAVIELSTAFRLQIRVTHLIPQRSFMNTVGPKLGDIRRPESTGNIEFRDNGFRKIIG